MTDARLTSIAERIDRLEDERKETAGLIADVYKEAAGHGYNTKALRTVLAARRKPTDETLAADIEMYRALLGMPGATYRSVSERIGVSKTKLQRLVPRKVNGTPDHDPATGEVIESSGPPVRGCDGDGPAASRPLDTDIDLTIPTFLKRERAA